MARFFDCLRRDERGMMLVLVGLGFMALLGAGTLAIDVGMFMTARNQAQNAADAGALAGAIALAFDDPNDRSPNGPAVQNAVQAARANPVMREPVAITPADVTVLDNPSRVQVHVYRTSQRGNPLLTLLGGIFGVRTADVGALATAEAVPADAASCVMPFTLPDKWIDNNGPQNCFEAYFQDGSRRPRADLYRAASLSEAGTGYTPAADIGTELRLRQHPDGRVAQPFHYLPIRLPGSAGPADYTQNVTTCSSAVLQMGDLMEFEPGDLGLATREAVEERIARDPGAYWDSVRNRVVSSMKPSPRVVAIPLFDPDYYDNGRNRGRNQDLKVGNVMGFFLESAQGDEVVGRIAPITALLRGQQAPAGGFARVIRLVE